MQVVLADDTIGLFLKIEVFQDVEGRISYRTVGWIRAASIFLKLILSTGVLSIPSAMYELGAVGGAICIVCFQAMNTCKFTASEGPPPSLSSLKYSPLSDCGILYGRFRMNHPGVHGITDVACKLIVKYYPYTSKR